MNVDDPNDPTPPPNPCLPATRTAGALAGIESPSDAAKLAATLAPQVNYAQRVIAAGFLAVTEDDRDANLAIVAQKVAQGFKVDVGQGMLIAKLAVASLNEGQKGGTDVERERRMAILRCQVMIGRLTKLLENAAEDVQQVWWPERDGNGNPNGKGAWVNSKRTLSPAKQTFIVQTLRQWEQDYQKLVGLNDAKPEGNALDEIMALLKQAQVGRPDAPLAAGEERVERVTAVEKVTRRKRANAFELDEESLLRRPEANRVLANAKRDRVDEAGEIIDGTVVGEQPPRAA